MTDSAPKIEYRGFEADSIADRVQVRDLINKSNMHSSGSLPGIGEVAVVNGIVIGYVGGHIKYSGSGHVDMFAVDSEYRRQGVGFELARRILHRLKHRGCRTFTAVTETDALAAIALYRSVGIKFKIIYEFEANIDEIVEKIATHQDQRSNGESIPVV